MTQLGGVSEVKPEGNGLQNQNRSLRERLQLLANHYSQSELARRTGVSKANVHRYLKAGRIPADWVQMLLSEFSINPAWLMLGQGEMLQSDVSTAAAAESGKLLELALKMNAVGHEKLAALQGRRASLLVRELSDTLARHDELREQVKARAKPMAEKLLLEYANLVVTQRHDESAELLAALRQLERVWNDWEMSAYLDSGESTECTFRGDYDRAIMLGSRALGARIGLGRFDDWGTVRDAHATCMGLMGDGRLAESANLASAMLMMSGGDPPSNDEFLILKQPQAAFDLEGGNPTRGVAILSQLASRVPVSLERIIQDFLLLGGYYTGVSTLADALQRNTGNPYFFGATQLMALWESDMETLARVRAMMEKSTLRPNARSESKKQIVDAILNGQVPDAVLGLGALQTYESAVLRCEAAHLAGKPRIAKAAFDSAEQAYAALGAQRLPGFLIRAMHVRRMFDYGDKEVAAAWFKQQLELGYGCLRPFAKQHGLVAEAPHLAVKLGRQKPVNETGAH